MRQRKEYYLGGLPWQPGFSAMKGATVPLLAGFFQSQGKYGPTKNSL
jgi:hypothetical protein